MVWLRCFVFSYMYIPFPANNSQSLLDCGFTYSLMKVCSCCLMDLWAWSNRICAQERRTKHFKIRSTGREETQNTSSIWPADGDTSFVFNTDWEPLPRAEAEMWTCTHVQLLPQQIFFFLPPPSALLLCLNEGPISPPFNCEVSVVTRPHLRLLISEFRTAAVWTILICHGSVLLNLLLIRPRDKEIL